MRSVLEAAGCAVVDGPRSEAGAPTLIARRSGTGRATLLLGHLDTVWPGRTPGGAVVEVADGRIRGPGVADMKGGLAVIAEALLASRDHHRRLPVAVVLSADEELGSPSAGPAIEELAATCDGALVFEAARPGDLFVNERSGLAVLEIEITGRAAHVAQPGGGGINAVDELVHQLLRLKELHRPEAGVTVMAGVIEGGTSRQVVPDHARAVVDVRARSQEDLDRVVGRLRAGADERHLSGAVVRVMGGQTRPPMPATSGTWLHAAIERSASRVGLPVRYSSSGGGSDANLTAAHGVPTVDGLGPEGFNLCSREESATVASGVSRAMLTADILSDGTQ
jgi:glutamate carboxypeptidase